MDLVEDGGQDLHHVKKLWEISWAAPIPPGPGGSRYLLKYPHTQDGGKKMAKRIPRPGPDQDQDGERDSYLLLTRGGYGRGYVHRSVVAKARAEADILREIMRVSKAGPFADPRA